MNNELRERIAEQIIKWYGNFAKTGYPEKLADQILALLPPRLSEEEILSEINKYGYWKNGVEWDFWKRGIARSLAGRIEKPIVEEKEYCKCPRDYKPGYMIYIEKVNPPICAKCHKEIRMYVPIEPKQSEHTKIEELVTAWDNPKRNVHNDTLAEKINELIQSTEKLWEAINKLRKE